MGISMISIMLFHQNYISIFPFNLFHNYGYWGVDVFLFLSGLGLVRSLENNSLPMFFKRRFIRIIPTCFFCGFLKYLSYKILCYHIPILKSGLHIGWLSITCIDLWFIPTILILYSISPVIYRLFIRNAVATFASILLVFFYSGIVISPQVGFNWFTPVGILTWTLARLPIFSAGIYIGIKKTVWRGRTILISTSFLIIAIFINLMIRLDLFVECWHTYVLFSLVLGMPSLLIIILLFIERLPRSLNKGLQFFGSHSLELYLVHGFIFKAFEISMSNNWKFLILLVSFCVSILTAYLCKIGIERIKKYSHHNRLYI